MKLTGVILAGGRSQRMGAPKALLPVGGKPMIARVAEALGAVCRHVLVVANDPAPFAFLGLPVVADRFPNAGPLAGLHAGLLAAETPYVAVAACDMPFLRAALVAYLAELAAGWDAAVPVGDSGYEPLCAVYGRSCWAAVEGHLRAGRRRMTVFFPHIRLRPVPREELEAVDPGLGSLWNANTPEDYQRALEYAEGSMGLSRLPPWPRPAKPGAGRR